MLTRITLASLLILGLSLSATAQQKNDLVGSYLFRFEWGGTRLTLNASGRFKEESSDCTGVTTSSGPYSISNATLRLTTSKITRRDNGEKKEHDLTKRKERKKHLDTDEPFAPSTDELQVVRWGERVYLMSSKSFEDFIDGINLGFEPRQVDGYRALYGFILLREGDEGKPVNGPPPLPSDVLTSLLPAPVTATVLNTEGIENKIIATIDKGSDDGLRKGMSLVSVSEVFLL
jgi:hypothetical protein